ncbi:MAG: AbrB/MazE/SpoVT family DNA-binding domain-containing protein [Polyangiales bacterium]
MSKAAISRITSKGQVTIPEEIRRAQGLQAGVEIEWAVTDDGTIEVRRTGGSLDALTKLLPRATRVRSVEQMDRAVGKRIAEKHRVRG